MMLDFGDYFRKALKFMIIGGIGALVNWAILVFLVQEFRVFYLTAEIIATLIAFGVNFNGNILLKNIKIRKGPVVEKASAPPSPAPVKPNDVSNSQSNSV
jgi:hypothetical protein